MSIQSLLILVLFLLTQATCSVISGRDAHPEDQLSRSEREVSFNVDTFVNGLKHFQNATDVFRRLVADGNACGKKTRENSSFKITDFFRHGWKLVRNTFSKISNYFQKLFSSSSASKTTDDTQWTKLTDLLKSGIDHIGNFSDCMKEKNEQFGSIFG
ncbi:Uncharacterised protein g3058 [Pycnogonum litorale]